MTHTLDRADCKFCKCWLQGDSVSIKHHEGGKRHKEMVEAGQRAARLAPGPRLFSSPPQRDAPLARAQFSMQERRDKRREGEKDTERDLQKQLRDIEAAAAMSMSNTRGGQHGQVHGRGRRERDAGDGRAVARGARARRPDAATEKKLAPPPPPPRRDWGAALERRKRERGEAGEEDEEADEEDAPKRAGVYEVKGVTYFEGEHHADKLQVDMACQLWLEAAEEWVDGVVTGLLEVERAPTRRFARPARCAHNRRARARRCRCQTPRSRCARIPSRTSTRRPTAAARRRPRRASRPRICASSATPRAAGSRRPT